MNWRAVVYTEPPLSIRGFVNQRRRWSSNAFFNAFILLILPELPLYIRFSTLIDITRLYSTIFRLVSYIWFWLYFGQVEISVYIVLICFVAIPYVYVLLWAVFTLDSKKSIGNVWFGLLLNKLIMPFLSVITISKMFLTASNFAWGGFVAKTEEDKEENDIEMGEMGDVSMEILDIYVDDIIELQIIDDTEDEEEMEIVVT